MTNTFWNGEYVFFPLAFFFFMNQKCTVTMINLQDQPTRGGLVCSVWMLNWPSRNFSCPPAGAEFQRCLQVFFFPERAARDLKGSFIRGEKQHGTVRLLCSTFSSLPCTETFGVKKARTAPCPLRPRSSSPCTGEPVLGLVCCLSIRAHESGIPLYSKWTWFCYINSSYRKKNFHRRVCGPHV